jgi:formyl-CoA transferase
MTDGPLSGIRVIEMGQAYAGPLAGAIMADLGADVIKIEKPDGGDDARGWGPPFIDGTSVMFRANNRSKRSVVLDIKDAADRDRLFALARSADIMIQNLRPGIVDEIGVGPSAMRAINPRLIYCSIWAFGNKGPLRDAPGFDPLLQAFGAVMTLTGRPDDPPTFCAPAINDAATAMWCVIGSLAALQQRQRTGEGCTIDTSLLETAIGWVQGAVNNYNVTGNMPQRSGAASFTLTPYQTFDTADRPICIAVGNDRIFQKFAAALERPEWGRDPRFIKGGDRAGNRAALLALVEPVLLTRTRDDWLSRLRAAGVPCAPVNNVAELVASEQFEAMDVLRTLPRSGLKVVGVPMSFDGARPDPYRDAPKLGEHTDEVMAEIAEKAG